MSVDVHINDAVKAENYIDNMMPLYVNIDDTAKRCSAAAVMAFTFLSHPFDPNDPLPPEVLLSMTKLMDEGCLHEIKKVLFWVWDTMHLLVSLSSNKSTLWSVGFRFHISFGTLIVFELETLAGHLGYVGYLTPIMHHFLDCIRHLKDAIVSRGVRSVRLSINIIADLRLFLIFLQQAHDGICMNLLTYRVSENHFHDDAYEKGIVGFDMATDKAWRWEIPREHWGKFTLNSMEFIAIFISF
jgi:hypothetical protein